MSRVWIAYATTGSPESVGLRLSRNYPDVDPMAGQDITFSPFAAVESIIDDLESEGLLVDDEDQAGVLGIQVTSESAEGVHQLLDALGAKATLYEIDFDTRITRDAYPLSAWTRKDARKLIASTVETFAPGRWRTLADNDGPYRLNAGLHGPLGLQMGYHIRYQGWRDLYKGLKVQMKVLIWSDALHERTQRFFAAAKVPMDLSTVLGGVISGTKIADPDRPVLDAEIMVKGPGNRADIERIFGDGWKQARELVDSLNTYDAILERIKLEDDELSRPGLLVLAGRNDEARRALLEHPRRTYSPAWKELSDEQVEKLYQALARPVD